VQQASERDAKWEQGAVQAGEGAAGAEERPIAVEEDVVAGMAGPRAGLAAVEVAVSEAGPAEVALLRELAAAWASACGQRCIERPVEEEERSEVASQEERTVAGEEVGHARRPDRRDAMRDQTKGWERIRVKE
jgi:hypothetical protein